MGSNSLVTEQKLHDTIKEYHENYALPFLNGISTKDGQGYIPCGARIGYYGTTAPQGFLLCDGSEYLKTQYPQLAALLAATDTAQSTTLFAGSDAQHFKVPDLRGEYTRGAGTNSHTGQGNGGKIGEHQDATGVPNVSIYNSGNVRRIGAVRVDRSGAFYGVIDGDANIGVSNTQSNYDGLNNVDYGTGHEMPYGLRVRPTSTSENMIIAYQDIYLAPRHQYSTEEHVVGTWIDRRPIYEKTLNYDSNPPYINETALISNVDKMILATGRIMWKDGNDFSFPAAIGSDQYRAVLFSSTHTIKLVTTGAYATQGNILQASLILQYTKTTDIVS